LIGFRLRLVKNPVAASLGVIIPLRSQRANFLAMVNLPKVNFLAESSMLVKKDVCISKALILI
jgi:hypothetical protein